MRHLRFAITMLIVLGLAMPTARATMVPAPAPAMEDCEGMMAKGGDDCPCCNADSKCPANVCAMKCLKTVANAPAFRVARDKLGLSVASPPEANLHGLNRRPPAPPPRA